MSEPVTEGEPPPRRRGPVRATLAAARPHQWVKNVFFVGAPLLFSKGLLSQPQSGRAAAAVAVFCLVSSAVYLWNDIIDLDKDRAHPTKRRRPIASGELPLVTARAMAASFGALSLALALWLDWRFAAAAAGYLALNVAYSLVLKRTPYVDVLAIAAGFLLRVVAGSLAIDVHASPWLLLCTGLVAAFLGFGKRRNEIVTAGHRGATQRAVLAAYRPAHLEVALYATGGATVVAYGFYTLAEHTRAFFHTTHMVWTVPLVAIGVGRFLMLVRRPESPTEELLRDPLFMTNLAAWVAAVIAIIYYAR